MMKHLLFGKARAVLLLALPFLTVSHYRIGDLHAAEAFERELEAACGPTSAELRGRIENLRSRKIPTLAIERKLHEGIAKRIPADRITQVLITVADNLMWVDTNLSAYAESLKEDSKSTILDFGNDVLMSGVTREQLAPVLAHLCQAKNPAAAASETAEFYLFLVNRLNSPQQIAWALSAEIIKRGDSRSSLSPFITVLQDIQQARGSLGRALEVALKRLQAGASLRAVKNELQEQFLRR